MYMSLFSTCGWILRLTVTVILLVSIHPALGLLAAFAAADGADFHVASGSGAGAEEKGASARRLARHLFEVATTAPPGKEVRVTRIGELLVKKRRSAWEGWYKLVSARDGIARFGIRWHGQFSGAGYIGAVVFVSVVLHGTAAQVLLLLAAGSRLSAYIGATVGEIGFLRGFWLGWFAPAGMAGRLCLRGCRTCQRAGA